MVCLEKMEEEDYQNFELHELNFHLLFAPLPLDFR